uniref:Fibronectin type-III domain-containing protein n=1 Tax=Amphimedon queenslandica TaxID=400682 RepID=A0A1X7TH71_AMPQE
MSIQTLTTRDHSVLVGGVCKSDTAPVDYPVIMYEIGYQQSNDFCEESIDVLATNLANVSSTSFNITGLTPDTRYVFAVRAYTSNGYGEWSLVANETLAATIFITGTGSKTVSIAFGTAIAILTVALMISLVVNICLCFCIHRRSKNNPQEDEQEIVLQLCEPYSLKNAILAKQNETGGGGEESKVNHTTSGLDAVYDYTDHDQNDYQEYGNDPEYIYIPNMEALKDNAKGLKNDHDYV